MSDLLFEIFCEEIPAGMQAKAGKDLEAAMVKALGEAGLKAAETASYVGARRLVVTMSGLPVKAEDVREERKGPRVGAPDKAVEGFLRGAGLDSLDACEQREDKKGAFWVALIDKPGRQTTDVLADAIPAILSNFHWPKSMKIGEGEKAQRWVRPIQRILCVFDGGVVPVKVFGLEAGNETEGHRVAGRGPFTVTGWEDYKAQLEGEGHVTIDADERKRLIMDGATKACGDAGLELVEDQGLLNEVCGLVEWPVPVLGEMDPDFLDLPPEVITLTMKTHQKYFAVRDPKTGALSAHFVTVANQQAPDGGKAIAAGNSRVLSARLSDARHFWDNDRKTPLSEMADQLSKITFHEKLGTVADKVDRVAALARELAPVVGANEDLAEKAARLAKADLVSEMVYEFPELQGAMGRYLYRDNHGLYVPTVGPNAWTHDASSGVQGQQAVDVIMVANAIRDHYKPLGPTDDLPVEPVSAAVALADKLDTLVGFWAIDEKPTGSKDPFALRRAALGVIRILLESRTRFGLRELFFFANATLIAKWIRYPEKYEVAARKYDAGQEEAPELTFFDAPLLNWVNYDGIVEGERGEWITGALCSYPDVHDEEDYTEHHAAGDKDLLEIQRRLRCLDDAVLSTVFDNLEDPTETWAQGCARKLKGSSPASADYLDDLLAFFADRLKVHLRDEGIRHDVIDAVFALGDDDLVRVTARSRALQAFLDTEDGTALLAGFKRASNILNKTEDMPEGHHDADAAVEDAEKALMAALADAGPKAKAALEAEDFTAAMAALAMLRAPIDAFFDTVTVNADDAGLRRNRLLLLSDIREAISSVADFSRIEG